LLVVNDPPARGGSGGVAAMAADVKSKFDHGDSDDDFMNSQRSAGRFTRPILSLT
jgi:hypothetical protein